MSGLAFYPAAGIIPPRLWSRFVAIRVFCFAGLRGEAGLVNAVKEFIIYPQQGIVRCRVVPELH
jgi:hypothetical protein